MFAMKREPENTINRIKALEELTKDFAAKGDFQDLSDRLNKVETKVNKDHESRITALETDLKALKDSMAGLGQDNSKIDTSQIMIQINLLKVEITKKVDTSNLEHELKVLDNRLTTTTEKLVKDWEAKINNLSHSLELISQDLSYFKSNDFAKLTDRVTELEKLLRSLKSQIAGLGKSESPI